MNIAQQLYDPWLKAFIFFGGPKRAAHAYRTTPPRIRRPHGEDYIPRAVRKANARTFAVNQIRHQNSVRRG
jgi:hypothetical protein